METPKIKSVKEVVKNLKEYGLISSNFPHQDDKELARDILAADRASLHTSLVAAVEGLPRIELVTDDKEVGQFLKAIDLDDTLTIINSIFKE